MSERTAVVHMDAKVRRAWIVPVLGVISRVLPRWVATRIVGLGVRLIRVDVLADGRRMGRASIAIRWDREDEGFVLKAA